ncbi:MAG: DUF6519 domain-containing protein [Terracidiphilus sp.]
MRGDFSRIRFNPAKHYSAVLDQQGRVELDADDNERSAIDAHLRDTTNVDVIGPYGGPVGDAGFEITVPASEILIGPGRYYVEGLQVEAWSQMQYDSQPYLIQPTYSSQALLNAVLDGSGEVTAHLSLEVWERLVTWLDDPDLVEPALGQADTTVRLQTVWRVVGSLSSPVLLPAPPKLGPPVVTSVSGTVVKAGGTALVEKAAVVSASPAIQVQKADVASTSVSSTSPISQLTSCCQSLYGASPLPRTGTMSADTGQGNNECGCQPIVSAGYQSLENQLYRVEIHTMGTLETATFKWSRENGSVVAQITALSGPVVTASSLGPDANLGFQAGQWVELSDDSYLFGQPPNQSGQLYQIQSLGPGPLQVTLNTPVTGINIALNARMRRWDQSGAGATAQGVALSSTATQLENGIEVTFTEGQYQTGDYWTIPARTANGSIDWPASGASNFFQPAKFTAVYSAPLACIHLNTAPATNGSNTSQYIVDDCRLQFPPLTAVELEQAPAALHVQSVSWLNDDVMTVDALLQQGLFVVFDNPPNCPWGGGNFQVILEAPFATDPLVPLEGTQGLPAAGSYPPGTDVLIRTVTTLDPPLGIGISGNQVNWITPEATGTGLGIYESYYLYFTLNTVLKSTAPLGFARVRIRLPGEGVYGTGPNGTMYLDGSSFGQTGARTADGSACVSLALPSGNSLKAYDYESWFYLAPSLVIANAVIQLMNGTSVVGSNNVTVLESEFIVGERGSLSFEVTGSNPAVPVTAVNAVITFTYPPVAATTLSPSLVNIGTTTAVGSIVTIAGSAAVTPGQLTVTVPINILANPGLAATGGAVVDTVGLNVSVAGLFYALPFGGTQPTLIITGSEPTFTGIRFSATSPIKPTLPAGLK